MTLQPAEATLTNPQLRAQFMLDPDIIYLNHGSAGACPKPVFEAYQRWQVELERQPTDFLMRRAKVLLSEARARLADYVHTAPGNLIFVTNATTGVNLVAHSLALGPGDEILTTDHEYGAVDRTWEFICRKTGAEYVRYNIPLPVPPADALVDLFWQAVTPRTRVISISHITSPTALILPVAEICQRARAAGVLTVIDGAHAPGQITVDLDALGADFYTGNCHKWMCAPKGSAFVYARPPVQDRVEPLIVSWECADESAFVRLNQWQGTRDIAAFLAVPDAIAFMEAHNWEAVRAACHALAVDLLQRVATHFGLEPLSPASPTWFSQMVSVPLPPCDDDLNARLYERYRIEVPIFHWHEQYLARVSVQGYNTPDDLDRLFSALTELLPCG